MEGFDSVLGTTDKRDVKSLVENKSLKSLRRSAENRDEPTKSSNRAACQASG